MEFEPDWFGSGIFGFAFGYQLARYVFRILDTQYITAFLDDVKITCG
jgi:hypothetical protein